MCAAAACVCRRSLCVPPQPMCAAAAYVRRRSPCVPPQPMCAAAADVCRVGVQPVCAERGHVAGAGAFWGAH